MRKYILLIFTMQYVCLGFQSNPGIIHWKEAKKKGDQISSKH